jgi:hypothetical protein
MGRQDFATYVPLPPLSSTRGIDLGPLSSVPEGFPQWISITRTGPQEAVALGA